MRKQSLVCDTSLLLYLGRIENEDLLQVLFEKVYVTEQVVLELDAGRLLRSDTINPRLLDWITLVSISQEEIDACPRIGWESASSQSSLMQAAMPTVWPGSMIGRPEF